MLPAILADVKENLVSAIIMLDEWLMNIAPPFILLATVLKNRHFFTEIKSDLLIAMAPPD
jgi:hypothetical protein